MYFFITFAVIVTMNFSAVFMKEKYVVSDNNSISWISIENFKTVVDASFKNTHCCNAHMHDLTGSVEELFNMFITIYPYSYVINYTTYECQAHLVLAAEEREIVKLVHDIPSKIATLKILIFLDIEVNDTSKVFDVTLYKNAAVKLISPSGIWQLSQNYLEKRVFKKINRYEDIKYRYEVPNFEGRELQLTAYYKPPHCYLNTMINKTINGVNAQIFIANNSLERDGIELQIIMILAKKLNFTWTVRKPLGLYRYGRKVNSTMWNGGMMELIVKQEVDMAFSGIWLKEDSFSVVNITEPWHQISINFLVPRPQPYTSFWALTRPFSPKVWIAVTAMLISYSIYLFIRARINPKVPQRYRHFLITIIELCGRLTGTWCPRNTHTIGMQLHLWQTAGLLVVAAYTSSLAARLTNAEYGKRIDTVQQFIEANLTWGRQGPEPNFPNFFNFKDPYARLLPDRFQHEKNDEERHLKIMEGNYAIIGRLVESFFFPEDNVTNEDLRGYRVMENPVAQFFVSFAVQPWLLEPINNIIYRLRESGILSYVLHDVLRRRAGIYLREVHKEYDTFDNSPRVVTLTPLGAGFTVLIVGVIISSIVFYFELRSIRSVTT